MTNKLTNYEYPVSNPARDRTIRFDIFNGELTSRSNFPAIRDGKRFPCTLVTSLIID